MSRSTENKETEAEQGKTCGNCGWVSPFASDNRNKSIVKCLCPKTGVLDRGRNQTACGCWKP